MRVTLDADMIILLFVFQLITVESYLFLEMDLCLGIRQLFLILSPLAVTKGSF